MAPINGTLVNGYYDASRNVIQVNAGDMYGADSATTSMRGRMPEIEQNPSVFSERLGLRRYKKLSYPQMKALRMSMPGVNACIDYIINRAVTFPFKIVRTDNRGKHNNFSEKRAEKVTKLLNGPNQFGWTYRMILSALLDDLLERDLGIIEKEVFPVTGGINQIGVLDSSKIRPNPKNYQGDLETAAYFEMDSMWQEKIVNHYMKNEIVWMNLKPQAGSFYGMSPIEYLDGVILMNMYSTQHNMKIVHPDGEKGGGIVFLGDIGKEARKEFEQRYEEFRMTDPQRPMMYGGGNTAPVYLDFRPKGEYDYSGLSEWLTATAASCFQLNMRNIGYASEGAGNAAELEQDISDKSAIIPRMLMVAEQLTYGVVKPAGGDDLELQYVTKSDEPLLTRAQAGSMMLRAGAITENEYRRNYIDETLPPLPADIGDVNFVISGNSVIKLSDAMKQIVDTGGDPTQTNQQGTPFKRMNNKQGEKPGMGYV